jgi:hypothetical protein
VAVLGTIITEWEAGRAIMHQLLSHEDKMAAFIEKCAQIAEFHGFQVGFGSPSRDSSVRWSFSYPTGPCRLRDLTRDGRWSTYDVSVLNCPMFHSVENVQCARMRNTLKVTSPTKLARLGHFLLASQAGRLAGPVFYVYVFSFFERIKI